MPDQTKTDDPRGLIPSRRAVVTALVAGALAPRAAQAVSPSLLGTWELVTFTSRQADGRIEETWGPHPAGRPRGCG